MPDNLKEVSPAYGQAGSIGAIPILILLAALGTLGFLLISNTFDFKDKLFSNLYLKSSSEAAEKGASLIPIPTVNPSYTSGWHLPGSHIYLNNHLNNHEHGDAPPQWVFDGGEWTPFSQTRESHQGYKGYSAIGTNNVESYIITHIITRARARSHGDHDYQLWVREPNNGSVSHWAGVLNFGTPPPQECGKTGNRPSIQEVVDNEAWYEGNTANVVQVANVIYGPIDPFCSDIPPGDGTRRILAWTVRQDKFPGPGAAFVSPTLAQYCMVLDGKGCGFKFKREADFAEATMGLPN